MSVLRNDVVHRDNPALDHGLINAAHQVIDADAKGEPSAPLDANVRAAMIETIAATHKISAADLADRTDVFVAAYIIALHNRIASKLK